METKRFALIRNSLRAFGALSLLTLLASGEAHAAGIWTHVASACAVDESSTAKYEMTAGRFKFKSGQTGTIYARCNVTNPQDDGTDPWWNQLEVVYRDPDGIAAGSQVKATLYRVYNSNGGVSSAGTAFDSNTLAATSDNKGTTPAGGISDFNFTDYAYFVQLQVTRSSTASDPTVSIVRLLEDMK